MENILDMKIEDYSDIFNYTVNDVAFFFGAGTSYDAGYPLIYDLTRGVVGNLNLIERNILDTALGYFEHIYDNDEARPNIEEIGDMIYSYGIVTEDKRCEELCTKILGMIREIILKISDPNLEYHIQFLERLKKRSSNVASRIFIFTPNYDLLFENAATEVGLNLINGFSGVVKRYYSSDYLDSVTGKINHNTFVQDKSLSIHLFKLHGSISWYKLNESGDIREAHQDAIQKLDPSTYQNCMILPRRKKRLEVPISPYDKIFEVGKLVLNRYCNNLVCAGYSFGDDHINDTLIFPFIDNSTEKKFLNFSQFEPKTLADKREFKNVMHICENVKIIGGDETNEKSDYWKFSEFVKLFNA